MSEKTKKNDFVEIKYTGYANDEIFDSNILEDLKKLNPESKEHQTVVAIGQKMLVKGFDNALADKEIGKEYSVEVSPEEGFGHRRRELVRTLPLSSFQEKNFRPQAGMVLALDNQLVKVLSVTSARVMVDFNNPLAGKNLKYKFTITRFVEDEKEKASALFSSFLGQPPEFEIAQDKITIKGPKNLEIIAKIYSKRFKELLGKELAFEEKAEEKKTDEKEEQSQEHAHSHEDHAHHDHEHTHENHNHSHDHNHEHQHDHSHDHSHEGHKH